MSKTSCKGKYSGTPMRKKGVGANCGKIKADPFGTPRGARRAPHNLWLIGPLGPTHYGHIEY